MNPAYVAFGIIVLLICLYLLYSIIGAEKL